MVPQDQPVLLVLLGKLVLLERQVYRVSKVFRAMLV